MTCGCDYSSCGDLRRMCAGCSAKVSASRYAGDAAMRMVESSPTRRERIATAVLAGLVASDRRGYGLQELAQGAIAHADALIAELDKDVKP